LTSSNLLPLGIQRTSSRLPSLNRSFLTPKSHPLPHNYRYYKPQKEKPSALAEKNNFSNQQDNVQSAEVFPPKAGFFHDEIEFPEGGNDISDKTVWKLAYKQDYC